MTNDERKDGMHNADEDFIFVIRHLAFVMVKL